MEEFMPKSATTERRMVEPLGQPREVCSQSNEANDGCWRYAWDAENRLVSLTTNTAAGPRQSIKFEYDWRGRRIRKQVWPNASWSDTPTNDVKFVYDGWNLLAELNATNNAVIRSFMWGSDLSGIARVPAASVGCSRSLTAARRPPIASSPSMGMETWRRWPTRAARSILAQYRIWPLRGGHPRHWADGQGESVQERGHPFDPRGAGAWAGLGRLSARGDGHAGRVAG